MAASTNKIAERLRSWAGNLRNGAYRLRIHDAAKEIERLESINADLLSACKLAYRFIGGIAGNPAVSEPLAAAIAHAERKP
jgi:hypothetical protein